MIVFTRVSWEERKANQSFMDTVSGIVKSAKFAIPMEQMFARMQKTIKKTR